MFVYVVILTFVEVIVSDSTTPVSNTTFQLPLSKACDVGEIAVNECNKCVCTSDHFFDCISTPCNKAVIQNIKDKISCKPNMLYIKKNSACLCKENGSWPHRTCKTLFHSFQVELKENCEPNTYVIIGCNVCKCGSDGSIKKDRCTKNKCTRDPNKSRRYIKQNQVYGSCETQNWYSLAPCQFCYCVSENKLVCNTGNSYSKTLELGSYNLSICGKDLIRDALNLLPNKVESALRYNNNMNSVTNEEETTETVTENHPYELNRENNENEPTEQQQEWKQEQQQIQQQGKQQIQQQEQQQIQQQEQQQGQEHRQQEKQQQEKNTKDGSEEYYADSDDEAKAPLREASSTKFPYEEDDNNSSSDSDNENQASPDPFAIDIEPPKPTEETSPIALSSSPSSPTYEFSQHFEWLNPTKGKKETPNDAFNLGDVLKPYLPVVLDKVFQMALRKSMVSIDAHANCTPGATTIFKCNACFCMKNNKLLCTNNECQ